MTLVLLAGFRSQKHQGQPRKVGPDYIDPGHNQMANSQESYNLEGWRQCCRLYHHQHFASHPQVSVTLIQAVRDLRKIRIPSYD